MEWMTQRKSYFSTISAPKGPDPPLPIGHNKPRERTQESDSNVEPLRCPPVAMAHHANISVTESQFRCPICLDVLQDPVSIPCGHTYCMACINGYWDQAEPPAHFSCPQCREAFSPRPVLRRNTVLAEVVAKLKPREAFASELHAPEQYVGAAGQVPCDFCPPESKLAAAKSCLVCLASFCEAHVLPHREVGTLRRHKLVAAVECPAERLCAQHRLGLQPRTGGDEPEEAAVEWSGECLLCEADRKEVHPGEAQRARRQVQLQESQRTVQGKIRSCERALEEFQQSLESLKVSASAVLEDSEALFADMAIRLEKTKAEVRACVEARERALVSRAERDAETLRKDLDELRRRDQEIERLLRMEDNEHFLQAAPMLCLPVPAAARPSVTSGPNAEAFSGARKALGRLRSRLEDVCREEVDSINRAGVVNVTAENFKPPHSPRHSRQDDAQVSCHLSLDPDTAHPTLVLFDGDQGAHCGEELQSYPTHPQRFDSVAQVLCREGQFGGPSYWEIEWRGGGWIDIGATYRRIGRKGGGKPCLLGRNENSWRLRCTHTGYAVWHDNRKTTVAAPPCPRIGVFLERHKGALSFYSVSDSVVLLHTFRCSFSQPIYPAFRLDLDSTLLFCPHPPGH
ncbi:tripartite motif-containing protein 16-like isoform X2 [Phyllopteryx taeniolatus]|uniref:tripartite motif-containing protein 16-like isoform X2 n=1 Tax=Phyllopteryx taeniolatus TaxID=161469 RepID=UPI002AD237F5|nr:tripartite motif-containing protein 16-like isoform X2 [Phyllopteryx taeniolatus]